MLTFFAVVNFLKFHLNHLFDALRNSLYRLGLDWGLCLRWLGGLWLYLLSRLSFRCILGFGFFDNLFLRFCWRVSFRLVTRESGRLEFGKICSNRLMGSRHDIRRKANMLLAFRLLNCLSLAAQLLFVDNFGRNRCIRQ